MSLLLDALKKAALDKQNRDRRAGGSVEDEPTPAPKPLAGGDLPVPETDRRMAEALSDQDGADQDGAKEEDDLSFDIEIHEDDLDFARGEAAAPVELSLVDDGFENRIEPTSSLAAAPSVEIDEDDAPTQSIPGETLPPEFTDEEPAGNSPAPIELARDDNPPDRNARKKALAQLLAHSRQTAARNRKRHLAALGGLTLTASAFIGFYFYYLSLDGGATGAAHNYVAPALANPVVEAMENTDASLELPSMEQAGTHASREAVTAPQETVTAPQETAAAPQKTITAPLESVAAASAPVAEKEEPAVTKVKPADTVKVAAPVVLKKPEPKAPVNVAKAAAEPRTAKNRQAGTAAIVRRNEPVPTPLSLAIREGYDAYRRGDMETSKGAYDRALALSPHHRDALLGAAAVAVRQNRQQDALRYYQQHLTGAPRDEYALAGILGLVGSEQPGPELESEVNRLLRDYPQAAHLHFLKGSLLAARNDWGAAQLAFFEAWRWDKSQPDYAYNLAIALDHIKQPRQAADLYRQALALAEHSPASFATGPVRERIGQLEAGSR